MRIEKADNNIELKIVNSLMKLVLRNERYKWSLIIPVFFFLSIFSVQAKDKCPKIKNGDAVKLYEKAVNVLDKDWKKAYSYLKEATKIEPGYYDAYYQLAMINYRRALAAYSDVSNKANIPQYNNTFLKYMNKVIELCPGHEDYLAYYYLGELYYVEKDYTQAQKYLSLYLESNESGQETMEVASNYVNNMKVYYQLINNPVDFEPVKLKGVCTPEDEFLPLISPDGEYAFYTHRYFKRNTSGASKTMVDEFTFSKRKSEYGAEVEEYEAGQAMPKPFNDGLNQGGISITIDNRELYVTICKQNKYGTNCDIFVSYNEDGEWGPLMNLGANVNGDKSWESQPTVSADGKVLYFASIRPENIGFDIDNPSTYKNADIYVSVKDENGRWGKAQNIGPKINTHKNDKSPFIHSDSQTLYFSSNGHPGVGGQDIFYIRYENDKWSNPKNIGYPINTEGDDLGFIVSTRGHKAYFASNYLNEDGGYDIYAFELYEEARPDEIMLVKGELKDDKGEAIKDAEIKVENTSTGAKVEAIVDKMTGKYAVAINVEKQDEFIMTVRKEDYAFTSAYIKPEELVKPELVEINLEVKKVELDQKVEINDIHFATSSSVFDQASMEVLNNFIEWMEDNPKVKIEIHGHTDNVGDPDLNLQLSVNRAKSVYDYMMLFGIDKARMLDYKGFGQTKPIAMNATPEGRAQNRRVEFVIKEK